MEHASNFPALFHGSVSPQFLPFLSQFQPLQSNQQLIEQLLHQANLGSLASSSSSSSALVNHRYSSDPTPPAFSQSNQQPTIFQQNRKVNDERKMEESDDERKEVISPKTAEKIAKEMDKKRPGSQGENGDGSTRRPRGRPRIYGMNREETNEKKAKEESGESEQAFRSDQDSPIDPSLHDFADGTKRRKYAPNLAKDDPKYLDMRRANNEAVKRNRDKAKRLQMLKDQELERLRQTVITLEKELLEEKDQNKRLNAQIETYKQILDAFASTRPPNVQLNVQ